MENPFTLKAVNLSDGLFKALLWNIFMQQIIYHYVDEFNLNNQAILSNKLVLPTSAILIHGDFISEELY